MAIPGLAVVSQAAAGDWRRPHADQEVGPAHRLFGTFQAISSPVSEEDKRMCVNNVVARLLLVLVVFATVMAGCVPAAAPASPTTAPAAAPKAAASHRTCGCRNHCTRCRT